MDSTQTLGYSADGVSLSIHSDKMIQYVNLKLAALGQPTYGKDSNSEFLDIARPLLSQQRAKQRLLANHRCPVDQRIQTFLDDYLKDVQTGLRIELPGNQMVLDRHGLARLLSLPPDQDSFISDIVKSYRIRQGVLHNPKNDRRTTMGSFHVAEGGLPIAGDKLAVPKNVFARLLEAALAPPKELMRLPFTSSQEAQAEVFVTLLMRPLVSPEVPGVTPHKSLETRFIAPGNLVGNLDFVESIFGNAGDPFLPENDSALDVDHWTGHTGCVILAPHLIHLKKKDLGLPHVSEATERQKRDGMCWEKEDELYNNGGAFKVTCRDERGVMVTLIADNYFGYCKKEVKTQIGFSSNLHGLSEEEHSGGALAFAGYDLGEQFHLDDRLPQNNSTFSDVAKQYGSMMDLQPQGYGIDRTFHNILYVPEDAHFNLREQTVTWTLDGAQQTIKLIPTNTYILPSGYKIQMAKPVGGLSWRLTGTNPEGTLCHKPCTVSGGGKSEISKSIADAMIQGPIFVVDLPEQIRVVSEILQRDFSDRFRLKFEDPRPSRHILSSKRSLGSVIKLFTPSDEYTDEYNQWLKSLPHYVKDLIFVIKRHYKEDWGEDWQSYFSVDRINGHLGHELKYNNLKLASNYLRVGLEQDGSWRLYKLRQDFNAAQKLQFEDDITASVVVPRDQLEYLNPEYKNPSVKLVQNCEYRLFQRPDEAIHRGYDKQAELDLSTPNSFLSNYEPLTHKDAQELMRDSIGFEQYTQPVQDMISGFCKERQPAYCVSSAHPRIVDGKPTKNPRYLQNRPDIVDARSKYIAEIGIRLFRKVPLEKPVISPVNAVLPGRRNNPPDPELGIPPLAVYNPIHYQDLPELFMDFICSLTGKSPSTTGFGTEGALTKGPFNAIWPTADLNNAMVSYIVTGYPGFSSAAGHVGPKVQVDHDISLLIPEIWCRMSVDERCPDFLIKHGYLEKLQDFELNGETVLASRLGYRITIRFVHQFLGRIFSNPDDVFSPEMLKPELQDQEVYAEGINSIVKTQQSVAQRYFEDGSIEAACPPLKALLHIMAYGNYEGKTLEDAEVRELFSRDYVLKSDWYQKRLKTKQARETQLWQKHIAYLKHYSQQTLHADDAKELGLEDRLASAEAQLKHVQSKSYLESLVGTLGADPFDAQIAQTDNASTTVNA